MILVVYLDQLISALHWGQSFKPNFGLNYIKHFLIYEKIGKLNKTYINFNLNYIKIRGKIFNIDVILMSPHSARWTNISLLW